MKFAVKLMTALTAVAFGALFLGGAISAHEGEGEDVGFAYLRATESNGMVSVEIDVLEPDPCDVFEPDSIVGQRGEVSVSGSLESTGSCQFQGTIELPESGRWTIAPRLSRNGQLAETSILVGVGTSIGMFENETWIHTLPSSESEPLFGSSNLLMYALSSVVGIATAGILAYIITRVRRPPTATTGSSH